VRVSIYALLVVDADADAETQEGESAESLQWGRRDEGTNAPGRKARDLAGHGTRLSGSYSRPGNRDPENNAHGLTAQPPVIVRQHRYLPIFGSMQLDLGQYSSPEGALTGSYSDIE